MGEDISRYSAAELLGIIEHIGKGFSDFITNERGASFQDAFTAAEKLIPLLQSTAVVCAVQDRAINFYKFCRDEESYTTPDHAKRMLDQALNMFPEHSFMGQLSVMLAFYDVAKVEKMLLEQAAEHEAELARINERDPPSPGI